MQDKNEILKQLNEATIQYYYGKPIMSDIEWDNLYNLYKELNNGDCSKVILGIAEELQKVQHNHKMLSLDKTKDINEFLNYCGDSDALVMTKLDGLTCSLLYENGLLVRAETRGDGLEGEDITHNALVVDSIPKVINFKGRLVVDGEIICRNSVFENLKTTYANPRNLAAGSIRLLDSKECKKRKLDFLVWEVIKELSDLKFDTLEEYFIELKELGFSIVPFVKKEEVICQTEESLKDWFYSTDFPFDGAVIKYNNITEKENKGSTAHHHKGGFAFKFYDNMVETKLKNIQWSIGRSGKLTPIAIFEEVYLDGKISRASLHNINTMQELLKAPYVNQPIYVYKANDIIPQVKRLDNVTNFKGKKEYFEIPNKCPHCGKQTIVKNENGSTILYCENDGCGNKLIAELEHFCKMKTCMKIKGLSKMTLQKLINWGYISNIYDIYNLHNCKNEWIKKDGFGEKSVSNILQSIEESKNTTLENFISALGIKLIGYNVAKELVKYFKTWKEFREAVNKKFDFSSLDNFGIEKSKSLLSFNYEEADKIADLLIFQQKEENKNNQNSLSQIQGLTICITGKLIKFKNRTELEEEIENCGGIVAKSVTKKVDLLVNNDLNSTSTKNKKAAELGIPVITELDLISKMGILY